MRPILDNDKCPRCEQTGVAIADGYWRCKTRRCGGFVWGWNTAAAKTWAIKSIIKQPFVLHLSEDDVHSIILGGIIRCTVERSDLTKPMTVLVDKRKGEGVHMRNEVLIPELEERRHAKV